MTAGNLHFLPAQTLYEVGEYLKFVKLGKPSLGLIVEVKGEESYVFVLKLGKAFWILNPKIGGRVTSENFEQYRAALEI